MYKYKRKIYIYTGIYTRFMQYQKKQAAAAPPGPARPRGAGQVLGWAPEG